MKGIRNIKQLSKGRHSESITSPIWADFSERVRKASMHVAYWRFSANSLTQTKARKNSIIGSKSYNKPHNALSVSNFLYRKFIEARPDLHPTTSTPKVTKSPSKKTLFNKVWSWKTLPTDFSPENKSTKPCYSMMESDHESDISSFKLTTTFHTAWDNLMEVGIRVLGSNQQTTTTWRTQGFGRTTSLWHSVQQLMNTQDQRWSRPNA